MVRFVTFGETMAQYNASYVGLYDENGQYVLDCGDTAAMPTLRVVRDLLDGQEDLSLNHRSWLHPYKRANF